MIYYQGHCAPGIYARSFLEGRLTEEQLIISTVKLAVTVYKLSTSIFNAETIGNSQLYHWVLVQSCRFIKRTFKNI